MNKIVALWIVTTLYGGLKYEAKPVKGYVGIHVSGKGHINQVYQKSPAAEARLMRGDSILTVEDYPYGKYDVDGPVGSYVTMDVTGKDLITRHVVLKRVYHELIDWKHAVR